MTLMWTALPAGMRRVENGEWLARVSVFLSPRLEVTGDDAPLSAFPEFVDWPKTLRELGTDGIEFLVQMHDGESVVAPVAAKPAVMSDLDAAPDSQAWRGIFDETVRVAAFDAPSDRRNEGFMVESYDARGVVLAIRDVYAQALATELGIATEAPKLGAFDIPATRLEAPAPDDRNPIEEFARFHRLPESVLPLAEGNEPEACPDFHQIVAATGTHPLLMRRLGLVLDLEVPASRLGLEVTDRPLRVRVEPRNATFADTTHRSLWTMVEYDTATSDHYRVFRAAGDRRLGSGGLYALGKRQTTVIQEELEHATLALIQQARNGAQSDGDDAARRLPALLQGGMRLTHADKPSIMRSAMRGQFRLEQSLQIGGDRVQSGVLGANEEEEILYAEHVTRGYRVDVQDVDSGEWRSLCRRAVSYRAGDWSWPAAGMLGDEGFIEPTAFAGSRDPSAELRASEDLFEWDGWSLVVPRPDRADDNSEQSTADCGTSLTVRLEVPAGSLEPQRFGRCYRFRLRNVDLAGNSLSVEEADELPKGFAESLVTDPVCCLRVESAKPPVVFRAQPRGPGEAGDVIVLRDAESREYPYA